MKPTYEEYQLEYASAKIKKTNPDGSVWYIPKDEGNADYQAYLRWLENPEADESGTL